jgi:hypothetical protein
MLTTWCSKLDADLQGYGILNNAGIGHNGTNVINGGGSADMLTGGQGNDVFGAFAVLIALCAGYPPHTSNNSRSY